MIHAIRNYKNQRVIYWGWIITFILVALQVMTGMTVVLTKLNLYIALLTFIIYHFAIRFTNVYDSTCIQK